ncbi:MAG: nitroreductase family protein [Candidatus Mcinerneyibacterium aminivorans]|uniref:Nitroreductase family protein n=1 Tax=Candidatus Mcinerneyibacterium aminivorans TaxID=2703815 RepID=A0A5D0MKM6_9BACT|nr:MAG: nitroreductase family protein [Candidatus Mcinerneyibacterium aminivorans]
MIEDLIKKNRSYRRFKQNEKVDFQTLKNLVKLARCSASGMNKQPIKFYLANDKKTNNKIFPALSWAGSLKNWEGPEKGERPAAYIILLGDKNIRKSFGVDHGIMAQSILLGAVEKGYGGCMLGAIDRNLLRENLDIKDDYEILLVLALGKPAEKVILENAIDGNVTYYRDKKDNHHVPKRPIDELIVNP